MKQSDQPHLKRPGPAALPVPLTVVGGFLGSGKSSLLNHVLTSHHDRRIAVLINDFGEINIDAKLIASVHGETIGLTNGCVCCTIRDDLLLAVIKLLSTKPHPDHILVETSGVSKPLAVAETFLNGGAAGFVELQNLIVVLDAVLATNSYEDFTGLAIAQIDQADLVVINKIDLVTPAQRQALRRRVAAISARARVWETTFGAVPLHLVFGESSRTAVGGQAAGSALLADPPGETSHGHSVEFATWTYRSNRAWSLFELQRAISKLPTDIYRAKGIVRLDLETGDYGILQLTGRRSWLRLCVPETVDENQITTELVFIGQPGKVTNATIEAAFEQAVEEHAADAQEARGYIVNDVREFEVVFS